MLAMKRTSSDCTEPTESSRTMRGAGKCIHEYLLELPSENAVWIQTPCVGGDGCTRYRARVLQRPVRTGTGAANVPAEAVCVSTL